MFETVSESARDLVGSVLPEFGGLVETADPSRPYALLDGDGAVVEPVDAFSAELQACGRPASTVRSYGMDLLRWWRFLVGWGLVWDRVTRKDARDFARWMQVAPKPVRVHWRWRPQAGSIPPPVGRLAGVPNPVTGRTAPGPKYSARPRAHAEAVLRSFYAFHLEEGTGPIINPFPAVRDRRRAVSAGGSMRATGGGRYRPKVLSTLPRRIPDGLFNELFAALRYHRDRALLAFWVSNGARAEELLTSRQRDQLLGDQLLGVIRKGTRAYQQLPSSPDALVWLRLYQEEAWRAGVPRDPAASLCWTLRRPFRPLTYHAARAMLNRANALLGTNWALHDLRHTAAYRMARDPQPALTDVQWILGHAHLTTTQIYVPAGRDEIVEAVRAPHVRQERLARLPAVPTAGYRAQALDDLFGESW